MDESQKNTNEFQTPFNEQLNHKIVINETLLLKKIDLIRRYYAEAKKAFVFFNTQNFDVKPLQKEIFQLFFSTKNYQGTKQMQFNGFDYIIYESSFKFVCKKKPSTEKKLENGDSQVFQLSKGEGQEEQKKPQIHDYHYFGQVLSTDLAQNREQTQTQLQESQNTILHGYGLLFKFQPTLFLNNTSQGYSINCYFGQFINGFKHGYGMQFRQRANSKHFIQIYIGNFINGNYDDQEAIWVNIKISQKNSNESEQNQNLTLEFSEKYYGGFVNGKKHGKGKISSSDLFYDGEWRFDKPQGTGQIWTSMSYYKGKFKAGLKHRQGKQYFKNGDIYEGTYSNNKPSGQGKYFWKNGSFYEGEFKNGLRDGKGLWKSGSQSYEGNYVNDKKSGQGIYYWNDGETYYKGSFFEDLRHGYGQMYWDNRASIYKGKWKEGFQDGYGEVFEVEPLTDQAKLTKKGQFVKGKLIEEIVQQNQTSIQPDQANNDFTEESGQFPAKQFSQEKYQQASRLQQIQPKKQLRLRKYPPQRSKDDTQQNQKFQITQDFKHNQRKKFVKSQNQNYAQFLKHQDGINANNRYALDASKNQIQKEHLYGSVYLIKSGRKRVGSSVQNIPKSSAQKIQPHSNKKIYEPNKDGIPKLNNKNHRSSSYSNTQSVNMIGKKNHEKLQHIVAKGKSQSVLPSSKSNKVKNHENYASQKYEFALPKRSSNQPKEAKLRYFDPEEEKNYAQLEPLIVWNNFSRNAVRRSFLK